MYPTDRVPTFDQMMNPLLKALQQLGGSGTIDEIYAKVIENMELPDEIIELPHSNTSNQSEVAYRLGWTRTYLLKD